MTRALTNEARWAREITERIRRATDDLYTLLLEVYETEVYKHLGYKTWTAYIDGEFEFNRQHSYRLLTQARVVKMIRAGLSPSGDTRDAIHITEAAARDIAPLVGEVIDTARDRVAAGETPREAVRAAVAITRSRFDDGYDEPDEPIREVEHVHEFVCRSCGELLPAEARAS